MSLWKKSETESQRNYKFARTNMVISILVFFFAVAFAVPNLTGASVSGSSVFVGRTIDGRPSFSVKAYGLDGNALALKTGTFQKVPDGQANLTIFVRPTTGAGGVYRTSNALSGTVQYKFHVLTASGKLSEVAGYKDAYVYYSPKSVFDTYKALKQEYARKQALLESDTSTDQYGMTDQQYYLSAMSWCEAYLTECLGQDGSRVWKDFSAGVALAKGGAVAIPDAGLKDKYSPVQFHLMPESEDLYRFPVLTGGSESLWGKSYDPLHKTVAMTGGQSSSSEGYQTYVTISDSPVVSSAVYRGYTSHMTASSLPVMQTASTDWFPVDASYFVVKTNAIWQVNHNKVQAGKADVAGKTGVKVIKTDLQNQTFSLISTEAYQQTLNPAEKMLVGVQQWFHSFLGGGDYIQDANVEKNLIGWAWSDKTDKNVIKTTVKDSNTDPNAMLSATTPNRAVYTGEKTLNRAKMLQEAQNAGAMPYPQTFYTDLQQGVDTFNKFQGFQVDIAATSIGMNDYLNGFDILGYYANGLRDFTNGLMAWAQPGMVNVLSSQNNFVDQGGKTQWLNRIYRGLHSPTTTTFDKGSTPLTVTNNFGSGSGNEYSFGGFFRKSQAMAQVMIVLFILWTVLKMMTSDWTGQGVENATELRDMIPRALFASVMIGLNGQGGGVILASMLWWVNDVVCVGLLDPKALAGFYNVFPISTAESVQWAQVLTYALIGLAMCVGYIAIICIYLLRAMAIWVLLLFMPWAWLCLVNKGTQRFTWTWTGMYVATLGIQFIHAIMLVGFISLVNTQELASLMFGSVLNSVNAVDTGAATSTWVDGLAQTGYSASHPLAMGIAALVMLFMMFKVTQSVFSQAMYSGRGAIQMAGSMARTTLITYPMRRAMRKALSGGRRGGRQNSASKTNNNPSAPNRSMSGRPAGASPTPGGNRPTPTTGTAPRANTGTKSPVGGRPDAFGGRSTSGKHGMPAPKPTWNPLNRTRPNNWSKPISEVLGLETAGRAPGMLRGAVMGKDTASGVQDKILGASERGWNSAAGLAESVKGKGGGLQEQLGAVNSAYGKSQQGFANKWGVGAQPMTGEEMANRLANANVNGTKIAPRDWDYMRDSSALNAVGNYASDLEAGIQAQGVFTSFGDASSQYGQTRVALKGAHEMMSNPAEKISGWSEMSPTQQQDKLTSMQTVITQAESALGGLKSSVGNRAEEVEQVVEMMPRELQENFRKSVMEEQFHKGLVQASGSDDWESAQTALPEARVTELRKQAAKFSQESVSVIAFEMRDKVVGLLNTSMDEYMGGRS